MVIISDSVTVLNKEIKEFIKPDGSSVNFFNITVGGMGFGNSVGVPEEVFKSVEVGDDIRLKGKAGFKRDGTRFWYFDELYLGK